jgi:NADH-quinone oxidoreductase subunit E
VEKPAKAEKVKAAPKPKATPKPKAEAAPAVAAGDVAEQAPEQLTAARAGGADDLKRISGVGPKLEGVLNEMGFYHFDQIAAWGPSEVAWVDARLKFKGRIARDNWIDQAATLASEA